MGVDTCLKNGCWHLLPTPRLYTTDMPMSPANKYFTSEWRRDLAGFPGGYVTDSGVHYIAAMRTIAKTAGVLG